MHELAKEHATRESAHALRLVSVLTAVWAWLIPRMLQSDDTMSPTAAVDAPLKHGLQACVDGNTAAAMVAYYLSDAAFIYPITPSSTMGEVRTSAPLMNNNASRRLLV